MDKMKMEWDKMMTSMNNLNEMMKGMDMKGWEEMDMEWHKMMDSAKKMQDMMAMKKM